MKFEIDEVTKLVTVFSEDMGVKSEKVITLSDFIESMITAKNKNVFEPIESPLFREAYGSQLIQTKQIGKKSCIYILHKKKAKMPLQMFKRFYGDVGYPGLLFAIKVVNDRLFSMYLVAVKDNIINEDTKLYYYPYTNVSGDMGNVCLGSNKFSKGISKKNNLFKVPLQFAEMPNSLHSFMATHNSAGYDCEEMVKKMQNREFDDKLLVEKEQITTYKEWFSSLK